MTTQYGERPGMTGTARREPWPFGRERIAAAICAVNNGISLSPLTCYDMAHALETLTRERDAARAEADRLRAALERIATETCDHGPGFCPRKFALSILRSTTPNADGAK